VDVTTIGTGFFLLAVVVWLVCAVLAYRAAPGFGRSAIAWGILALVFGPLALFALYLLPRSQPKAGSGQHHADPRADLYEVPNKKKG
jgi:hypothetical protein